MNGRKVVKYLLVGSAFNRRNFTSLGLVMVFVAVYIMSGGKVSTAVPRFQDTGTFGTPAVPGAATVTAPSLPAVEEKEALKVLGVTPSDERQSREDAVNRRGRLFDGEEAEPEILDKNGLLTGDLTNAKEEAKLRKLERRRSDSFSAIEERLKIKRNK